MVYLLNDSLTQPLVGGGGGGLDGQEQHLVSFVPVSKSFNFQLHKML